MSHDSIIEKRLYDQIHILKCNYYKTWFQFPIGNRELSKKKWKNSSFLWFLTVVLALCGVLITFLSIEFVTSILSHRKAMLVRSIHRQYDVYVYTGICHSVFSLVIGKGNKCGTRYWFQVSLSAPIARFSLSWTQVW